MSERDPDVQILRRLRATWQPAALSRELTPGRVIARTLLGEDIVLARLADGPAAWAEGCPHRGARFALGWSEDAALVCPYHGWSFGRDGGCRAIPSLGGACAVADGLRIRAFACHERYGFVWVRLADEELAPIPDIPEFEDPRWTYVVAEPMRFGAGFRREIENYLDMSHFAFAHRSTLGKAAAERIARYEVDELADGVVMRADFPSLEPERGTVSKLQEAHRREQRAWWPNVTTIRQTFADGDERVLVHVPAPETATSCTVFWSIAISPGFRGPAPEQQLEFAVRVLEEDRRMCENQRPLEVPLTGEHARYVPADRFALTWRRGFARWVGAEGIHQRAGAAADPG